jgi:hypothetical protein
MKLHCVRSLFTELQRPTGFDLPLEDELSDFDNHFRLILHKHLTTLTLWSIFNCVGGFIGLFIMRGYAYYFWMMNGVWGVINLAVVIVFFYHTLYRKIRKHSAYECLLVQSHVEQMMFLNIGLNTAYVVIGFWLREHSFICNVSYQNLWFGFGCSIIMQGLFLLVQDMMILRLHRRNFRRAQPFFEELLKGQ